MVLRSIFSVLLIAIGLTTFGQGRVINLYNPDSSTLAVFDNGKVRAPGSGNVLYTVKGNIIFEGDSENKNDILYAVKSKNFFSKSRSYVYASDMRETVYTIRKGKVHLGQSTCLDDIDLLVSVERTADAGFRFESSFDDEFLGYISNATMTQAELVMAVSLLSNKHALDKRVAARMDSVGKPVLTGNIVGAIRAKWRSGPEYEWVWDGEVFRPRYIPDIYFEWVYDGEIVKPKWQHHLHEEYEWDGETLSPLWGLGPATEFIWDGRILKPYWSPNNNHEYIIEDGMVRPYLGNRAGIEWELYGEMPLPLIAIVVLGIAFR